MGEMKEILTFCLMYSGVLVGALAYTFRPAEAPRPVPQPRGVFHKQ